MDGNGNVQWENTIGGSGQDRLFSIQQTMDGGLILGGYSASGISVDKTENLIGANDYWIIKLDSIGIIQWQNTIGGTADEILSIAQTLSGGYILSGTSSSGISGDKTEANKGDVDYWIIELDSMGNVTWDKTIGGSNSDGLWGVFIKQTFDGGYIVAGSSNSSISGDKTETSYGGYDYWVLKLDGGGNIQWQNTIGGNLDDALLDIEQTIDGGYILGGYSASDVSGDKSEPSIGLFGYLDFWVVKLDSFGEIIWQNTIGGDYNDALSCLYQTFDGGYILGGVSISGISGDKTEANFGQNDYWVVKLNTSGNIVWDKTLGGNSIDVLLSLDQTFTGGYVLGGYSFSEISGNKTVVNIGDADFWVVKIFPDSCVTTNVFYVDNDSDGFGNIADTITACIPPDGYVTNSFDCNDSNSTIHIGALEICNSLDDNCNGEIDDGLLMFTLYFDTDMDGYGNVFSDTLTCYFEISGYLSDSTDCTDLNNLI